MSDTQEPSYYEIALTNRQVLVSFVVLLCCVLAAFASGIWLGRKGSAAAPEGEMQLAMEPAVAGDFEQLEELKLGSERQEGEIPTAVEPAAAVTEPRPETTLAEDVGSSPPPRSPPPPTEAAQSRPPPPPARQTPPPPARQTPPPPAAPQPSTTPSVAASTEGFVIQVLSTRDEVRAKKVLDQLLKGGYPAFLSPVQVGTQVNHRVRIGPYEDRPPAEKAAQEINVKYQLDTWITAASN